MREAGAVNLAAPVGDASAIFGGALTVIETGADVVTAPRLSVALAVSA
jgi:hypothetical protein